MVPWSSKLIIPSEADSKTDRTLASLSSSAMRTAFCSVWSLKTRTTPLIAPSCLIGAAQYAMERSAPSRAISRVSFAHSTTVPSVRTRCTGFCPGLLGFSFTMRKISSIVFPLPSSSVQPVSRSATGFICCTRVPVSVVITASPIEYRIVRNRSSISRRSCSNL